MAHARHAVALPFVPRDKEALMPFLCRKKGQEWTQGAGKVRVDEQDAHKPLLFVSRDRDESLLGNSSRQFQDVSRSNSEG